MIKFIKRWYHGEEYNISTPTLPIFPGIRYKRHWSSRIVHICQILFKTMEMVTFIHYCASHPLCHFLSQALRFFPRSKRWILYSKAIRSKQ